MEPLFFLWAFITAFAVFNIAFIIAQVKKDNSIVDSFWGLGFVIIAAVMLVVNIEATGSFPVEAVVVAILVGLWGLRLSLHIHTRNKGKGEDYRYVEMRKKWGDKPRLNAYFKVFMVQMLLQLIIALPIIVINMESILAEDGSLWRTILYWLALLIWVIGYVFQVAGDAQLKSFKRMPSNRGRIMTSGLWRYTRHPNYFGESAMWFGIGLFTVANTLWPAWFTIISPLLITYLLLFVSGVPLLEKKFDEEKGEEWTLYKKKTSKFFPLPPRKDVIPSKSDDKFLNLDKDAIRKTK
ncbi:MAG: DUF1295 domain-containing protein [Candidatus Izemoplasmataceae bacterium]